MIDDLSLELFSRGRFGSLAALSRGAAMGGSFESNAINGDNWTTGGWVAWLRRYAKGAVDIPMSRVFATAGYTSNQIVAAHLADCVAAQPAWCFVDVSGNDILHSTPMSTTMANVRTIVETLQTAGIFPILMPMRAFANVAGISVYNSPVSYFNQWCKTYCEAHGGVGYWDVNPEFINFENGYANGNLVVGDGIHDSTQGAQIRGLSAWNYLKCLLPVRDSRFTLVYDTYDAVGNQTGNLFSNGLLDGVDPGSPSTGPLQNATGQVALGWALIGDAANSVMVAGSEIPYDGYTNLQKQRITLGGTAHQPTTIQLFAPIITANFLQGADSIWSEVEVDWNITSGTVAGVYLMIQQQIGGTIGRDGQPTGWGDLAPGSGSMVLRTDPALIPDATNSIQFSVRVDIVGSGSSPIPISGTVDVARASVRKSF